MKTLITATIAILTFSASISAQTRNFLLIPNIEGESVAVDFEDQIEVIGYSLDVSKAVQINASSPNQLDVTQFEPLRFTAFADKALPKIIESIASGTKHVSITLSSVHNTGDTLEPFLVIEMGGAYIVQASLEGTSGDVPVYEFGIDYETITITYTTINPQTGAPSGNVPFTFDRKTAVAN